MIFLKLGLYVLSLLFKIYSLLFHSLCHMLQIQMSALVTIAVVMGVRTHLVHTYVLVEMATHYHLIGTLVKVVVFQKYIMELTITTVIPI